MGEGVTQEVTVRVQDLSQKAPVRGSCVRVRVILRQVLKRLIDGGERVCRCYENDGHEDGVQTQ